MNVTTIAALRSISAAERLSICLRFLASGDSFRTIANSFRVGASTVASIVSDVVTAIWDCLVEEFMAVPTAEEWRVVAERPSTLAISSSLLTEHCRGLSTEDPCLMSPTAAVRECIPGGAVEPLPRLGRVAANNAGREAIRIRETFTSYFSEEGTVSWQGDI
ncbi:unnamed protein product [Gadus morhua 'NCC']